MAVVVFTTGLYNRLKKPIKTSIILRTHVHFTPGNLHIRSWFKKIITTGPPAMEYTN